MRIFGILALVFGIVIAGGAVFYAQKFMDARLNAVRADPVTVRILVAKQRLTQGDLLGTQHLQWIEWPTGSIPDGAFSSTTAVFGPEQDQRRFVKRTIEPGEPILEAKLSAPNQAGTIKDILLPNMRAVAIRIDDVSGVSGLVGAVDHVDILLTHKIDACLSG